MRVTNIELPANWEVELNKCLMIEHVNLYSRSKPTEVVSVTEATKFLNQMFPKRMDEVYPIRSERTNQHFILYQYGRSEAYIEDTYMDGKPNPMYTIDNYASIYDK
uniref:Uncharacterized protein n=1 Tax=viral metagenome TaxID=1070528 RepID=A0A6C0CMY8_9ZZZZ